MNPSSLINELRRRIRDQNPNVQALTIGVSDTAASSAFLELTQGRLIFTGVGGSLRSFDIDLFDINNATIGKLHQQLQRMTGLVATLDKDANPEHPSGDLEAFGPVNVRQQGTILRHRIFANGELLSILGGAINRHNPSMNVHTLPEGEKELVLTLAQAAVAREKAGDAVRRKGTAETVAELLSIARGLEMTYQSDAKRLARVLQPARESRPNAVHQGDVMLGSLFRRSLRTGYLSPSSASLPPAALVLLEADDLDDQDTNVRVRWERSTEPSFSSCELWMDTQPEVFRQTGLPSNNLLDDREIAIRDTTAVKVGSWVGPNAAGFGGTMGAGPVVENAGHLATGFVVSNLEPETDYYFRLYVFSVNGEYAASEVVRHHTKPLRCTFADTSPITPLTGTTGTVLTLRFSATMGVFTAQHRAYVGGKLLTTTIVSGVMVTAPAPAFVQKGLKDIVVISPTGLKSILKDAYTAT